jgi:hypothetical protein
MHAGRVNLLGENVVRNGRWVPPVAIDRAAFLPGRTAAVPVLSVAAPDLDTSADFLLIGPDAIGCPAAALRSAARRGV